MSGSGNVRLQVVVVIALFLASLGVLCVNAFDAFGLSRREVQAGAQLREAGQRMAAAATRLTASFGEAMPKHPEELDRPLHEVTQQVLQDFPGVEGGFYLADGVDRFSGYAFPTGPPALPRRNEPPPLEAPDIRLQARQSLAQGAGPVLVNVLNVETSRVLVATTAVGPGQPARAAAWVMLRLTGPKELEAQVQQFRLSVGLALGGIVLSLILTGNLGRTLSRQRREQEQLRDELRRAEHLAALGKLLAGVAHEVRNPLAGIRSTVQLWQRLPDTTRNPQSLEAVVRAVDRLNDIVSRLLYFARPDKTDRQPIAMNRLLEDTLNLLHAQAAGQSVGIERDLAPDLPPVLGSASALQQVFLNLATNALQAMPHGGRLVCRTRRQPQPPGVEISFADTGPGISPEGRRHLFEPFFTTRPEGTGLGLALCREIVTRHGGRIDVESPKGAGAIFRLSLPAA